MKRIVQKIKSYSKSIDLSKDDKDDLRARLESFMKAHPYQEQTQATTTIKSPYTKFFALARNPFAITAFIALITGSSITYAASDTLPGDILYPVKVYVNENVEGTFILGTEAKAAWNKERAERRLEEIQTLLAHNELDTKKAIIAQVYLDEALQDVAASNANDEEFQAALDAHAAVLARIDNKHVLANSQVNTSITKAKTNPNRSVSTGTSDTESILSAPTFTSATDRMTIAKERLALVSTAIDRHDLDKETKKRVKDKMDEAHDTYENGSLALAHGDYELAQNEFIESMMVMQEAKLLASVPKFLGIEDTQTSTSSSPETKASEFEVKMTDDATTETDKEKPSSTKDDDSKKLESVIEKSTSDATELKENVRSSITNILP